MPPSTIPQEKLDAASAWWERKRSGFFDAAAFDTWLNTDPQNEEAWTRLETAWHAFDDYRSAPEILAMRKDALDSVYTHGKKRWAPPLSRRTLLISGLASTAAAAGMFGLLWHKPFERTFLTGTGEQKNITLPDGSRLTMDAHSHIQIRFESDARNLKLLQGRAHFEVAKNASRPFRVTADNHIVTAIGTAFSVESRAKSLRISLYEGRVNVAEVTARDHPGVSQDLQPMEQFLISDSAPQNWQKSLIDPQTGLAWRDGRLYFKNESLAEVVGRMNDYAPTQIDVVGPAADFKVSGMFIAGQTDAFIEAIRTVHPIEARYHDQKVTLQEKS